MIDFKVSDKCIMCGQCVKDCPVHIIAISEGLPFIKENKEADCLKCQHCLAVCPEGAISILGKLPEKSQNINEVFPKYSELELLAKGRRSIRRYKDENVDKEMISKLLSSALHAPTGVNAMDVDFFVVDDKDEMQKIRIETYKGLAECAKKNSFPVGMEFYKDFLEAWENKGHDNVFRRAPHMVIAASNITNSHTPLEDAIIALSYFELLAASAGLGTVWCGLAKMALKDVLPYMKQRFGIPENYQIEYVMMFGKPAVKYFRTVQRDTADKIHRISSIL